MKILIDVPRVYNQEMVFDNQSLIFSIHAENPHCSSQLHLLVAAIKETEGLTKSSYTGINFFDYTADEQLGRVIDTEVKKKLYKELFKLATESGKANPWAMVEFTTFAIHPNIMANEGQVLDKIRDLKERKHIPTPLE